MTDEAKQGSGERAAAAGGRRDTRDAPDDLIEELKKDVEDLEAQSFADSAIGTRQEMHEVWRWVVFAAGLALSLFHLYTGFFGSLPSIQQRTFHLGFGLGLIFLLYPGKTEFHRKELVRGWVLTAAGVAGLGFLVWTEATGLYTVLPALGILALVQAARHLKVRLFGMPIADVALSLLGFGAGLYLFVYGQDEIFRRVGQYSDADLALATIGFLLVLVATQRVVGTPLVAVTCLAVAYAYFGPYMPGFLAHRGYSLDRILSLSFLSTEGVFGTPIGVSARFIFLFMVFASLLQRSGMEKFFTQLAFGAMGWMTGGTAKVGVLTSAFSGTITGSSVANTVSNGAFTIPMMKKAGYKPEFAGAVEAASSTGGQLAPPVMGAAAFIMIELTGLPYRSIIQAAIIPAILFFAAQFVVVHYESKRQGVTGLPRNQLPSIVGLMMTKGYLLLPVIIIFWILAAGFSAVRAALYAIIATVLVNVAAQVVAALTGRWHQMEDKLTPRTLLDALVDAARIALPIIAACAAAGVIAGMITLTGVGLQLSSNLLALAQDTLILTMVFAMIACLVLGIGLPTTANYVITATLAAPALLAFDAVPVIAAHMFVYYFGIMADITPPVSLASYAASGIARSNPFKTGVQSVKIALGGFLLPYMFVLSPQLLLQEATWFTGTKAVITAMIGVYCIGTAVVGFIDRKLDGWVRITLALTGLGLLYGDIVTDAVGIAVAATVFAYQWRTGRRNRAEATAAATPRP
jgi:TRAP transporter 4TM/12TM fusion protein